MAANNWAVITWSSAEVARLAAAFSSVTAARIGSSARIQPIRRPPQSSFDADPTATTRVLSAASGGGAGSPSSTRSARLRSSMIVARPASAIAATAWRRMVVSTVPVGLWPVGIR